MVTYRRRPPRLPVLFPRDTPPLFFVTAVTWQRQPLLANPTAHDAFRAHALRIQDLGIAVGRYVLMPDHIHVFLRMGAGQTLSLTVKHLKESITKALHVQQPALRVWQPGAMDHLLRHDESYAQKWAYVQQNPVRATLVTHAEEWPYQGEIVMIDRA